MNFNANFRELRMGSSPLPLDAVCRPSPCLTPTRVFLNGRRPTDRVRRTGRSYHSKKAGKYSVDNIVIHSARCLRGLAWCSKLRVWTFRTSAYHGHHPGVSAVDLYPDYPMVKSEDGDVSGMKTKDDEVERAYEEIEQQTRTDDKSRQSIQSKTDTRG